MRFISKRESKTIKIGEKIAREYFKKNKVVFLKGDLGAGKTTITKGFAKGLDIENATITSPTFTIMNEYYTDNNAMFHIDMYRIESPEELVEIGLDAYILGNIEERKNNIVIIEWPERISEIRKEADIEITINKLNNKKREIIVNEKN